MNNRKLLKIGNLAGKITALTTVTVTTILTVLTKTAIAANLVIPKPQYLVGPTVTQQSAGEVRSWFAMELLPSWATGLIGMVAGFALLMLVISGVRYLTAYGSDETAGAAKKMALYSIVGLLLAVFSYAIVVIIANLKI